MTIFRQFTADDAVRAAEAALARATGRPVAIGEVQQVSADDRRNLILRASAVAHDASAEAVIIKATRAPGTDAAVSNIYQTSGFLREWAATTLLARRAARHGRRAALLAADTAQGVLVLRDFGAGLASLVQPLLHGSATAAEQGLTAYALALARLHGETVGCRAEHGAIVREGFPAAQVPPPGDRWIERIARPALALVATHLPDLPASPPESELALLERHMQAPGPWQALMHGDPCPDNVLLPADGTAALPAEGTVVPSASGDAVLIDFEFTRPGHALLDAAYWRMGFPTCWCAGRVPEAVSERIDQAYRAALAEAVPTAANDAAFRQESALISVAWLFGALSWRLQAALGDDPRWGLAAMRGRILHYLETAVALATAADALPGTRAAAAGWLDALRVRWPDSTPLALYPAFAPPPVAPVPAPA
jgi:hypothetical protein